MFARVKKSGNNQYLQIVENRKISGKVVQRVISTVGRLDRLQEKGEIENPGALSFPVFRESAPCSFG